MRNLSEFRLLPINSIERFRARRLHYVLTATVKGRKSSGGGVRIWKANGVYPSSIAFSQKGLDFINEIVAVALGS